jgi:hypothetical protein
MEQFETAYLTHLHEAWPLNKCTREDLRVLREGDGYGPDASHLTGAWWAWQHRSRSQGVARADVAQPEKISGPDIILTGAQLLEALDFIAPDRDQDQLESEVAFAYGEGHGGTAMYVWCAEYPDEGSFVCDGSSAVAAPAPDESKAEQEDEVSPIIAPYPNCSFRICDLPGQCRSEGSCHHPKGGRDSQPKQRAATLSEEPSFSSPLTPYGLLVRALRIVAGTTLYDMSKALLATPAELSAQEFGRKPVTQDNAIDVSAYFDALGVPDTLAALKAAILAARNGGKHE